MQYIKQPVKLLVILIFLILSTTTQANYCEAVLNSRTSYINRYKKIAISEMERTGIPASIKLAQGILESADGKSELAQNANNHFGIKCGGGWKGKTYHIKDDDKNKRGKLIKSCFRVYGNPDKSYYAHSEFLTNPAKKARYGFLFNYKKTEYKKWAKGLKKAGYATDPKYPSLLIDLIERHNLHKFDRMQSGDIATPVVITPNKPKTKSPSKPKDIAGIFYTNDIKSILVKPGQTTREISQKYNILLETLLKYNEMSKNIDLKAGTRIYLQPKRATYRGKESYHIVKRGEDMFSISQLYGLKLDKLCKRNKMTKGEEPAVKAKIILRGKAKKKPKLSNTSKNNKPITKPTSKPKTPSKIQPNKDKTTSRTKPSATAGTKVVHIVKAGETLYRISKKYGVSVDNILKINKLSSNTIEIGQELIIKR